jgi:uncharacterized membrane protein YqiK
MKRLFILLALVIVFSCTSRYHKADTTQDVEVKTQGWENNQADTVKDESQIKVLSTKFLNGVQFTTIEVYGNKFIVSGTGFIQPIKYYKLNVVE